MKLDRRPSDPRALRELANGPEVQAIVHALALDIQRDARRLAPVRTGNLRRNIKVEGYTDLETGIEGYAVGWDDDGWYGWLLEQGTERLPVRAHLIPAAIKNGVTGRGGDW